MKGFLGKAIVNTEQWNNHTKTVYLVHYFFIKIIMYNVIFVYLETSYV